MGILKNVFAAPNFWISFAVLAVGFVLWIAVGKWANKALKKMDVTDKNAPRIRFAESIARLILILAVILTVLQQNGINLSSVVAGLGIAGIVVGFALQDILKDIIMGINIVWDQYFSVDDVIRYNGEEGRVVFHDLRVTKIQDMDKGNIRTISNRNISEIEKLSERMDIPIPAPYPVPADTMRSVCREMCARIDALQYVTGTEFLGTDSFADSCIYYLVRVNCSPIYRHEVRRNALGIVQDVLAEQRIDIPYRQIDVHLDTVNTQQQTNR